MTQERTKKDLRLFGLSLGAALALIATLRWVIHGAPVRWWLLAIAGVTWALAIVAPAAIRPIEKSIATVGHAVQWFALRVTLVVIFFVWILPMAMIRRARGRDVLRTRREPDAESYRAPAPNLNRETMERPY